MKHLSLNALDSFKLIKISTEHQKEYFGAHRHNFYEIVYITQGKGVHKIDFEHYEMKKNTIHLIRPHQIHDWILKEFKGEYDGYILCFTENYLFHKKILHKLFDARTCCINVDKITNDNLSSLITMMEYELHHSNELTSRILNLFLNYVNRCKIKDSTSYIAEPRIYKLSALIDKYFIKEKSALFYANKLDLTTKRLNELTKKYLDKTLSSLIIERVIMEAKRELVHSEELSIKDISEKLGFNEVSYFSKYFKQYTNCSPQTFKKNMD